MLIGNRSWEVTYLKVDGRYQNRTGDVAFLVPCLTGSLLAKIQKSF